MKPSRLLSLTLAVAPLSPAPLMAQATAEILTPKPPAEPRVNGPKIFGVRPGSPFLFTIPATGERPMSFAAKGLPAGLKLDAATGRRQWKDGRYGTGQLLLASGHLVELSGEGEVILVRATPEQLDEVARFQAIQGKTRNHPAIAEGRLLVRNAVEMACFDLSLSAAAQK